MNNKITVLSAAVSVALAAPALAGINDIIISEDVEGTSDNRAIEVMNLGNSDFTFNGDHALYYSSGSHNNIIFTEAGENVLNGLTVPAGDVAVIYHPDASDELINTVHANTSHYVIASDFSDQRYNSMNFNGDDSVFIADSDDHTQVYDLIGEAGADWGEDKTFRRLADSATPSTDFNVNDWLEEPKNTFDGLGDPTLAERLGAPMPCTDAEGNLERKLISEVQGTGYSSPLIEDGFISDKEYLVTGIVTGVMSSLDKGFYLQSDPSDESHGLASVGVFVEAGKGVSEELIGQKVCVRGFIKEDYGMTKVLATDDEWETVNADAEVPDAIDLTRITEDGDKFQKTLERHEGMLVRLVENMDDNVEGDQNMRVSRSFSFDFDSYRNNMVLAYKRPNMQPNQEHIAGSYESKQQSWQNNDYRLYVDTDKKAPNGEIPYYPDFLTDAQENYIRINDTIINLEGHLYFSFGDFRLVPSNEINDSNVIHNTDRTDAPELNDTPDYDQFGIRIATQNVLNYFNSPYGGSPNKFGDNRGAESEIEFQQQQAKLVKAIYGLDADIIGLMEIENNGFGDFSAISQLVNEVNANYTYENYDDRDHPKSVHNKYVFVGFDSNGDTFLDEEDSVGTDAITSGLLYRPSKVNIESTQIIQMPRQQAPAITDENGAPILDDKDEVRENGKNYQRDTVAATFLVQNTGKKLTVAVNHFKSKGSTCWEDWQGWETWEDFDPSRDDVKDEDFQGSCEHFRVSAAHQLGKKMARIGGDQVVMGDMNSYANEDPMLVLTTIPELPEGKTIRTARDTYIGDTPQFGEGGKHGIEVTESFGFINSVSLKDAEKGQPSWSYSFNDEIGSLDHVLITPSLKGKLLDATDWHINAAESSLFDYKTGYKGDNQTLYNEDPFRSSDHDSALIALGYRYGETDAGERVLLATKSGRMEVGYPIDIEAKAGDIASIAFSPQPDNFESVILPRVELTEDGKQTVLFDISGVEPRNYTVTMTLERPQQSKSGTENLDDATVVMDVEVVKRDSLDADIIIPPHDGSGGAFGLYGLLSLLGLGFLRRRKN
ncbi:nuclease [Photobacterium sanctipauli]|uniref:Nuclease n=1 Tax=Photobacterium sanctipauli TaxID=1342794 RepID=A0A2T3NYX5_9GAMM|nr:ExeM/NucH family extracellular endonuclease [Photobacterium sanctipauli]PSW21474.1 nuclease [Photobacterium sanctipauli]